VHIPDGFVSTPVNLVMAAISAGAIGTGLAKARRAIAEKPHTVPLLATTAAFVFAAQMLNFPIGGGTSGHFLGAVTAAALLGPWNACLVMAVVLVIQGFFFADGGITALGTNLFNMGVVGGMGGYMLMRGLRSLLPVGRGFWLASAALASWASVVLASASCAVQLAVSGTSPLGVAFPAMVGTHAVIGIGEALIAMAVLTAAAVSRPDILPDWAAVGISAPQPSGSRRRMTAFTLAGLLVALLLAVFISPFASPHPDGLEKVAGDSGFTGRAAAEDEGLWSSSPFPDYSVEGLGGEAVSTGVAGLLGTAAVFGAGFAVIRISRGGKAS
jgi:cobalt/nickel transport system permease protein